jgi:hypothetical protein
MVTHSSHSFALTSWDDYEPSKVKKHETGCYDRFWHNSSLMERCSKVLFPLGYPGWETLSQQLLSITFVSSNLKSLPQLCRTLWPNANAGLFESILNLRDTKKWHLSYYFTGTCLVLFKNSLKSTFQMKCS